MPRDSMIEETRFSRLVGACSGNLAIPMRMGVDTDKLLIAFVRQTLDEAQRRRPLLKLMRSTLERQICEFWQAPP